MSKKPVTMSVARPSRAAPKETAPAPVVTAEPASEGEVSHSPAPVVAHERMSPEPAAIPRLRTGSTARLDQGIKRIVVDVAPSVHKQVKVKSVDYSGGIKEYILRLLEADGLDLRDQPDFVPRPK